MINLLSILKLQWKKFYMNLRNKKEYELPKCDKCFEYIKRKENIASAIIQGGKVYKFCEDCFEIAKDLPPNGIHDFVKKDSSYIKFKIVKSKEVSNESLNKVYIPYKNFLLRPIQDGMDRLFCGKDDETLTKKSNSVE